MINTANVSNNLTITIRASHKYVTHSNKYDVITNLSYIGESWLGLLWNKYSQLIIKGFVNRTDSF